jgi:8-oxo-dGTP pyrophosphatase MutT (NUDIX family)
VKIRSIAVVRECQEELGYRRFENARRKSAIVDDFYNLIGRENHQHYFLCLREGD